PGLLPGYIDLDSRGDVNRAAKHDGLASCEHGNLIEQALRLPGNDPLEVVDVVGILKPVGEEIGALADDRGADFARPLARNDERKSELPPFLCYALEGPPRQGLPAVLPLAGRTRVIVRLFQDQHPRILVALLGLKLLS